jgi:uncharacterized protein (TIGR02118 family)
VHYPNGEGKKFDLDYYVRTHMPMAGRLLKPLRYEVDKGIAGGAPGSAAPFVASCHFYFNTLADFQKSMSAHGQELIADVPNYTNIQPEIQMSEIVA